MAKRQPEMGIPPSEAELAARLGERAGLWPACLRALEVAFGPVRPEWARYSAKTPWTLRVVRGEKKLVYLVPDETGGFAATVVLGEKAAEAALGSELPEAVKRAIREARKYAEGRPVKVEVRDEADVGHVRDLVRFKLWPAGPSAPGVGKARRRGAVVGAD